MCVSWSRRGDPPFDHCYRCDLWRHASPFLKIQSIQNSGRRRAPGSSAMEAAKREMRYCKGLSQAALGGMASWRSSIDDADVRGERVVRRYRCRRAHAVRALDKGTAGGSGSHVRHPIPPRHSPGGKRPRPRGARCARPSALPTESKPIRPCVNREPDHVQLGSI